MPAPETLHPRRRHRGRARGGDRALRRDRPGCSDRRRGRDPQLLPSRAGDDRGRRRDRALCTAAARTGDRRRREIGNFVETKNARLAPGAKASHLSYLGDTIVGEAANIGAGTITCNYDGFSKYPTEIGAGAFIGSNTALVAPVTVRGRAIVAAGSTITRAVPQDGFAIARARQQTHAGRRHRHCGNACAEAETRNRMRARSVRLEGRGRYRLMRRLSILSARWLAGGGSGTCRQRGRGQGRQCRFWRRALRARDRSLHPRHPGRRPPARGSGGHLQQSWRRL